MLVDCNSEDPSSWDMVVRIDDNIYCMMMGKEANYILAGQKVTVNPHHHS